VPEVVNARLAAIPLFDAGAFKKEA